ncbi:MAG: hypothetical protein M3Y17_06780 [Actinomycetota bacterium]|nr:hypothetical protein [Actinomycetota bacterium]
MMSEEQTTPQALDEDVARIIQEGEAGVGTAMQVLEAAERVYFGAVAATSTPALITSTNSTW